jgi:hypothetical protein
LKASFFERLALRGRDRVGMSPTFALDAFRKAPLTDESRTLPR